MAVINLPGLYAALRNAGLDTNSITSVTFNSDHSVGVAMLERDEEGRVKVDRQTQDILMRFEEHAWKDPEHV